MSRPTLSGRRRAIIAALAGAVAAVCLAGCSSGGGGGGGGGSATVTGTVLRAETGLAPSPAATVTVGGVAGTTNSGGGFTIAAVPAGNQAITIAESGAKTFSGQVAVTAGSPNNLGTFFLSDTGYNATVVGKVVTADTGAAVGGATVTIAGISTLSAVSGSFTINGLPVGLGNVSGEVIGQVTAPTFALKQITSDQLPGPLAAGTNNIGNVAIAAAVSGTPPSPPYTVTGKVTVNGAKPTSTVTIQLSQNGNSLGTVGTDATGAYFFWVVPGTYTVQASLSGFASQTVSVTLQSTGTPVTAPVINLH